MEKESIVNDDILKALQDLLSPEEIEELLKANKPADKKEDKSDEGKGGEGAGDKGDDDDDDTEELEKAEKEVGDLEGTLASKKEALNKLKEKSMKKGEGKSKPAEGEDKKEAIGGMLKGMLDELSASRERENTLVKALEDMKANQAKIEESLEKIGSQSLGRKAVATANYIEKGNGFLAEKETGNIVLSVRMHKENIEKSIENLLDSSEISEEKKQNYTSQLLNFNSGGAPLSKGLMEDLAKFEKVTLSA